MPTLADVNEARGRLHGIALHTPLEPSPELALAVGAAEVRLKREEVQPTGAFKTRGAHNKVALVAEARPEAALVTASSGNHGIAVATAAVRHGMRLTVLVGRSVSPAKLERLRALESSRVTVELTGNDSDDAEIEIIQFDSHSMILPTIRRIVDSPTVTSSANRGNSERRRTQTVYPARLPEHPADARIAELGATDRAAQKVALQVFDFDRARRIGLQAPQRLAIENDVAQLETAAADREPEGVAIVAACSRHTPRRQHTDDLVRDFQFIHGFLRDLL